MKINDVTAKGLQIMAQLKTLHWQTTINSHHVLYGDMYAQFDQLNDELMQLIMGYSEKRISVPSTVEIKNIGDIQEQEYLKECADFYKDVLEAMQQEGIKMNIRKMMNLFNKSLYLFRQK